MSVEKQVVDRATVRLCVDGAMNKNTGGEAWASVTTYEKKDVLKDHEYLFKDLKCRDETLPVGKRMIICAKFTDVVAQQNNGAELLAMLAALRIALYSSTLHVSDIFTDSNLIFQYWSKGKVNEKTRKNMDPQKLAAITECSNLRTHFEGIGGCISFVPGSSNPADLGWHR